MPWVRRLRVTLHAFTLGLLCLAQFVAYAHLTLVSHSVCAEHGELVHAGDEHASPGLNAHGDSNTAPALRGGADSNTAPALRGGADSNTAPALRGGADSNTAPALRGVQQPDTHGHDHCVLAADRRERALTAAPQVDVAPAFAHALPALAATAVARLARDAVLDMAPKTSPPA